MLSLGPSPIHGTGVFATQDLDGQLIPLITEADVLAFVARTNDSRTDWGRYINHADVPNAAWIRLGGTWYARAGKIPAGAEVTLNYGQGPWFVAREGYVNASTFPLGIRRDAFGVGAYAGYGFPPIVIPLIAAGTALVGAVGTGVGVAGKSSADRNAQLMQAAANSPCVADLNAQIAAIKDGSVLTRWASKSQQDAHARKLALEAKRDQYLSNPALCAGYVNQGLLQQQAADTASNTPYLALAGVAILVGGLAVVAAITRK